MKGTVLTQRAFSRLSALCTVALVVLLLAGCAGSAPSPTPTVAPKPAAAPTQAAQPAAAPTQAAAPTKVAVQPTVAPTAAPAKKVDWPAKDKPIMLVIGYPPGGATDVSARMVAPYLEKELGAIIQIVNKGGAGTQIGLTELAKAKPDGYTIGQAVLPTNNTTYLEASRQAVFGRKDFIPVAGYLVQPNVIGVKADGPYKTLKDLVDAAKAKPEQVKVADSGMLATPHLGTLVLQQVAGVKFASVHFEGGAPALAALLGDHVDAQSGNASVLLPQVKTGQVRVLGTMDKDRDPLLPDVPTTEEQGYKAHLSAYYGFMVPAGTPKEIADTLEAAVKKVMQNEELKKRMVEAGQTPSYSSAEQFAALWDQMDKDIQPLLALAK